MKAFNFKFLAAGSKGVLVTKSIAVAAGISAATYGVVKVHEYNTQSDKKSESKNEMSISKDQFINLSSAGFILGLDKLFSSMDSEEAMILQESQAIELSKKTASEQAEKKFSAKPIELPPLELPVPYIASDQKVGFDFTEEDFSYFEKFGNSRTIVPAYYDGGNEKLNEFLSSSISYPKDAIEQGIEGTVCVQFEINSEGKIENVHTVKSVCESIDKEAERIVRSLPNWKPKQVNMENVPTIVQIPIKFDIQ